MPPSSQAHHARSHALLLLQKLLNLRDGASPLTLVLDSLEQSGKPLVREFITRAKIAKSKVLFVSFTTLRKPADADVFVKARGRPLDQLRADVAAHYPPPGGPQTKTLLIIDSLNALCNSCASSGTSLPHFLSSLLSSPAVSLVGTYHTDVPLASSTTRRRGSGGISDDDDESYGPLSSSAYAPHPLATLAHLATAILRAGSLPHAAARRAARNRSLPEPEWGLREGREGVLIGLRRNADDGSSGGAAEAAMATMGGDALIVEMELRRRSGRAVVEQFVLTPTPSNAPSTPAAAMSSVGKLSLLADHAAFRDPADDDEAAAGSAAEAGNGEDQQQPESTFNLGLTDKQRRDREGIVLPYFDAQTDVGGGEGGRILYQMGREDDFDDEEDEI